MRTRGVALIDRRVEFRRAIPRRRQGDGAASMNTARFDRFARELGAARSRRSALRLALAAGAFALFGKVSRTAATSSICGHRVANPDHAPTSNGCGTAQFPISGKIGAVDLAPACNRHDLCYDSCDTTKDECDQAFLTEMGAICAAGNANGGASLESCLARADAFHGVVRAFGEGAYADAQAVACRCCAPEETACGGRCLPACPDVFARDHACRCVWPTGRRWP